jgi:1-deoxy-D-xylulose-5-phosphate synthase
MKAADLLAEQDETRATVLNARFCKPLDSEAILMAARRCECVVTVEDGVVQGGFGSAVLELLADRVCLVPTARVGLPDSFLEHGPVPALRELAGLTADEVAARARQVMRQRVPVEGLPEDERAEPARSRARRTAKEPVGVR